MKDLKKEKMGNCAGKDKNACDQVDDDDVREDINEKKNVFFWALPK